MLKPITVAICVYNAEDYLQETLDSLKKQTYNNIHFLFVNDGSTDDSLNILNKFCQQMENSKIINLKNNSGTAVARNIALENANTEHMMFFDSDDIARPQLVETLMNRIEEVKNCIAVSCYAQYISDNGKKLKGGMFMGTENPDEFIDRSKRGKLTFMVPATVFIRERAIKAGGYRKEGFPKGSIRYEDLSEDLDLWSRMSDFAFQEESMIVVPKVLYYYRKRSNSLSAPKEKQYAMSLKIKYIKENLKRRRRNEEELTFIEYLDSLTSKEQKKYKRGFYAEYYYRKAAFAFVDKKFLMIVPWLITSLACNPVYLIQKFTANYKK